MEFLWPGMRRENSTGVFDCHVYMYVKGRHFIAMRRQAGQPATGRDAGTPGEKLLPDMPTNSPVVNNGKQNRPISVRIARIFTCSHVLGVNLVENNALQKSTYSIYI